MASNNLLVVMPQSYHRDSLVEGLSNGNRQQIKVVDRILDVNRVQHKDFRDLIIVPEKNDVVTDGGAAVDWTILCRNHIDPTMIVVLVDSISPLDVHKLKSLEVNAIFSKRIAPKELRIRLPFIPGYWTVDTSLLVSLAPEKSPAGLSNRELQVARLLCDFSIKEIASFLHLSEKTVSCHHLNLFKKLGIHTAKELIHWCAANQEHYPVLMREL